MLKIWGRSNSINVQKVMWVVGELAIPHQPIDAGMQFGVVDEPWFRAMNPNGRIPTIDDDGFILWESNAIVCFLASKYGAGNLSPASAKTYACADRWMDWSITTLASRFCRINLQKWKYGTCQSAVANVRRIYLANA